MNESNRDRIARVVVGGGLLALGAFTSSGAGAIAAIGVGVILVGTGAVGCCPIYAILRIGTKSPNPVS